MDWRWLLFSLVAAAIAAVRLRRKPPPHGASAKFPPTDPVSGAGPESGPEPVPSDNVGPVPGTDGGTHTGADTGTDEARHRDGAAGAQPPHPAALTGDQGLDRSLDQALDTAFGAAREPGGVDAGRAGGHRDRPPIHGADAPGAGDPGDPGDAGKAGNAGDAGDAGDPVGPEALDAALERVWAEHAGDADTLLAARLRLLVHRGVPARALRPAPGTRTVRVVFADGTVVLCRGTGQGDFGRLGLAMLHHSVRLGSFRSASDGGTRLEFRWHPDQRLAAVAVGLDQPD